MSQVRSFLSKYVFFFFPILTVAILECYRGKQRGSEMLTLVENLASEKLGITKIFLRAKKKLAVQFYYRLGFRYADGGDFNLDHFDERHPCIAIREFSKSIGKKKDV